MALPKEPRQKMINIMYLVLTALLALNVSSEILNAFKTVNNSLVKTTATVNKSTGDVYQSLVDKKSDPATAAKAAYWEPKAKAAMDKAATANAFIQGLKDEILRAAGGDPNDPNKKFKEDNLDIATRLLIKQGKGKQLLQVLTDFRNNMLGLDDSLKSQIEQRLQIDLEKPKSQAGDKKNWEETYFHMCFIAGKCFGEIRAYSFPQILCLAYIQYLIACIIIFIDTRIIGNCFGNMLEFFTRH